MIMLRRPSWLANPVIPFSSCMWFKAVCWRMWDGMMRMTFWSHCAAPDGRATTDTVVTHLLWISVSSFPPAAPKHGFCLNQWLSIWVLYCLASLTTSLSPLLSISTYSVTNKKSYQWPEGMLCFLKSNIQALTLLSKCNTCWFGHRFCVWFYFIGLCSIWR